MTTPNRLPSTWTPLPQAVWRARQQAHQDRVDRLTAAHLARRTRGERHPVWDFMFNYYPVNPGQLRRWHPGVGFELIDGYGSEAATFRDYRCKEEGRVAADLAALWARRGKTYRYIQQLLRRTAANESSFSCFGLHEWAMVYRSPRPRHPEPLRLGQRGTDAVVEKHDIKCSHYDAYRFFTAAARPLNALEPTREQQEEFERPSCLHANMDLYKWATKLGPLVPGELWLDCFEHACRVRLLDMASSPYDLREWDVQPVRIETPEGKTEFVARQRQLAAEAAALRAELLTVLELADSLS